MLQRNGKGICVMKDKMESMFGGLGLLFWIVVGFLMVFAPTYILGFPLWLKSVIVAAYYFAPTIMTFVLAPLYVWAIVAAAHQPIDAISIVFFALAGLYFFGLLIPTVMSLFAMHR